MKHLFTLNARFFGSFVFVFVLLNLNSSQIFSKGGNDAGISAIASPSPNLCAGTYNIIANLKNNGNLVLSSAVINWTIVGVTSSSQSFSGSLMPDSIIQINLGPFIFTTGTAMLKIWSSSPNGKTDSFPNNDTSSENINILPNATVYTGSPFSICSGNTATIGGSGTPGYGYTWTSDPMGFFSGSSNPSITPFTTTKYYLTVINDVGCTATDSVTITVNQTPGAYPGPFTQTVCKGKSITLGLPAIVGHTYFWASSPPGFSSKLANPTVAPTSSVTYTLYEAITATGCTNSNSTDVTVLPAATAYPIKGPQTVCHNSSAIYLPSVNASGYTFTFMLGDSVGSTGSTLIQNYDTGYVNWGTPGKVKLLLLSMNIAGCQDTNTLSVNILPPPVPLFTSSVACNSLPASFSNTTLGATDSKWVFGDGDTSTGLKANHIFKKSGIFPVKMIVIGQGGCIDSLTQNDTIFERPSAGFTIPKTLCVNSPEVFGNTSSTNATSWLWKFGDSIISADTTPTHTYTKTGSYKLSQIASNAQGCKDTLTRLITINLLPSSGFNAMRWTYRNFNFLAKDTTQPSYSWNYGDTTSSATGFRVSHSFKNSGLYHVKLTVISPTGCSTSTDSVLFVKLNGIAGIDNPELNFTISPNPFTGLAQLSYTLTEPAQTVIQLSDISGRHISDIITAKQAPGTYTFPVNASELGLKPGIYFINANINGAVLSRQIVKME